MKGRHPDDLSSNNLPSSLNVQPTPIPCIDMLFYYSLAAAFVALLIVCRSLYNAVELISFTLTQHITTGPRLLYTYPRA